MESIYTFYGHKKPILKCKMNNDCSEFYSAGLDHVIRHWKFPDNISELDPFTSYCINLLFNYVNFVYLFFIIQLTQVMELVY